MKSVNLPYKAFLGGQLCINYVLKESLTCNKCTQILVITD